MDADSAAAKILEVLVPIVGVAIVALPIPVAPLKRRWLGPFAAIVGVGTAIVVFRVEPSPEFQRTSLFWVIEKLLNVGVVAGIGLMLFSALRPAREGSWWNHRQGGRGNDLWS
jgi:hypothetical protein